MPRYEPPEIAFQEQPAHLCSAAVNLFKVIAYEENDIEGLRQVFAHMRDFTINQRALFDLIDRTKSGNVSAADLLAFLQENLVKEQSEATCQEMISEFDSNGDGMLNFDEFINLVLPSSDYGLRNIHYHEKSRGSAYAAKTVDGALPAAVSSMAARILERESLFHKRRDEARKALAAESEETLTDLFMFMSNGQPTTRMTDFIWFCERYGFSPSTEDLEAILRRCDHDADRALGFDEFADALGRDINELMNEKREREEKLLAERELALEALRKEKELARLEWEKKLELKKLEREKKEEEARLEAEDREIERKRQLEIAQLERELELEKMREAEEARRLQLEEQMLQEKMLRE